ncbi:hypothetical protein GJ496_004934 [Pomphorhynchus laevis]|nr:hypothetical protein GJ496_004934 [Pomphorhynchus laevis]
MKSNLCIIGLIIFLMLLISKVSCERFYRLTDYDPNKHENVKEGRCWRYGQYYDKGSKSCVDFPKKPTAREVKDFSRYRYIEMEYICQQMWLSYSKELKLCVMNSNHFNYLNKVNLTHLAYRVWLKRNDQANKTQIEEMDEHNAAECLKGGRIYDLNLKDCEFIYLDPMEKNKIEAINKILTKDLREEIWNRNCRYNGEQYYNPSLKMCIQISYRVPRVVSAIPNTTFVGNYIDSFERRLYCALLGRDYYEDGEYDGCRLFNVTMPLNSVYEEYTHVFIHAKQIICGRFGMLYQREIDICIETPEIQVKRKKRYIDLCLDPRCEHKQSTAEYGPNLYLLVSQNDQTCFEQGLHYAKAYDRCEQFPDHPHRTMATAYRLRYLPLMHQMLRTHCYKNNLDYSKQLQFCISKTKHKNYNSEHSKEERKVSNSTNYRDNQWSMCMNKGLDYNYISDQCIPYPKELTSDDRKYFEKYRSKQVKTACEFYKREYMSNINYCPKNGELEGMGIAHEIDLEIVQELRTNFLIKYCHSKRLEYDEAMNLCVAIYEKSKPVKHVYTDLAKQYCIEIGRFYDPVYDSCIRSPKDLIINPLDHQKTMCEFLNQEYDPHFGFCVMRRKSYEKETPVVPVVPANHDGHELCLKAGMEFDININQCVHFPHIMSKKYISTIRIRLKKYIDRWYKRFCEAAGQPFDSAYRACGYTDERIYLLNKRGVGHYASPVNKHDGFYCFLEGLTLERTLDRTYYCDPLPQDEESRRRLGEEVMQYRKMYIHHRCPIYSTYDDRVQFCIRRPQKEFKLMYTKSSYILLYPFFRAPHIEVDDKSKSIRKKRDKTDEKCCMSKGLTWSTDPSRNICLKYRVQPTPQELEYYKEDKHGLRNEILAEYCYSRKLIPHENRQICIYADSL